MALQLSLFSRHLPFRVEGGNKDAYDLTYIWRGLGVEVVAREIRPFLTDPHVDQALTIIRENFTAHNSPGPVRAASFATGGRDDDIQADVVGLAQGLLSLLK